MASSPSVTKKDPDFSENTACLPFFDALSAEQELRMNAMLEARCFLSSSNVKACNYHNNYICNY